jgi:hypothetical protein
LFEGYQKIRALLHSHPTLGIPPVEYDFMEYQWTYLTMLSRTWNLDKRMQDLTIDTAQIVADVYGQPPWLHWNEHPRPGLSTLVHVAAGDTFIPGMDIFNHVQSNSNYSPDVRLNFVEGGLFAEASVLRPVVKGQQLFTTYGDKPNVQLLFGFHFTIPPVTFPNLPVGLNRSTLRPLVEEVVRASPSPVASATANGQGPRVVPAYKFEWERAAAEILFKMDLPAALVTAIPTISELFKEKGWDVTDISIPVNNKCDSGLSRFVWVSSVSLSFRVCPSQYGFGVCVM